VPDGKQRDAVGEARRLQADTQRNLMDFLRAELSLCQTLAGRAEGQLQSGEPDHAGHTLKIAEKGYSTVERFLSDPKYNKHISGGDQQRFAYDLEQLGVILHRLRDLLTAAL
jgi:hypothetical protein